MPHRMYCDRFCTNPFGPGSEDVVVHMMRSHFMVPAATISSTRAPDYRFGMPQHKLCPQLASVCPRLDARHLLLITIAHRHGHLWREQRA